MSEYSRHNMYKDEEYIRQQKIDFDVPKHVGIIMDGNGRWAKKRLLPRNAGHKAGADRLQTIARVAGRLGIDSLTVYAFSTENWKRPQEEVSGLMTLLADSFAKNIESIMQSHVRIVHLGETKHLEPKILEILQQSQLRTKDNDGLTLNIAFNYGGRLEIVHALKAIAQAYKDDKIQLADITEQLISNNLYTAGQPDPDLIIRTSGEIRLSNFMLYQAAYSEIMPVPDLWPDFSDDRFIQTLRDFSKRSRRFGAAD